jgi:hypothetical protein
MEPHTPDDIVNARAARDVLGWQVFVHPERRRIVGGLPPGIETGLCPIPPFLSNWKAAMKLRDHIRTLPADRQSAFLDELRRLVGDELGVAPLSDAGLFLHAEPRHVTIAALKALPLQSSATVSR